MNKYYKYFALLIVLTFFNCESDDATKVTLSNYVGFEIGSEPFRVVTVDEDVTGEFEVKVYASESSSSDRTYGLYTSEDLHWEIIREVLAVDQLTQAQMDAYPYIYAPFNLPSQVVIPAGTNEGSFTFTVTDNDDLGFVNQYLPISFVDESGRDFSTPISFAIQQTCLDTIVSLELTFDNWAEECVWEIYDLSGTPTVVETGGSGGAYDAFDNSTINLDFCLPSGDYGIVVYDLYGDGGTSYTVTSGGATLASGATPDAGGGYPVTTQSSATYTVN